MKLALLFISLAWYLCAQAPVPGGTGGAGGSGSGTVTSVSGNNGLTGTVTTTGSIGLATTANNTALCNNSGSTGVPTSAHCTTTGTGNMVMAVSPALTGAPTAPTQTATDNSTDIATDAFVQANVAAGAGAICPNGTLNQIFTTTGSSTCQTSPATADLSGNILAPGTVTSTGNTAVGNNLVVVGTASFNTGCTGAGCITLWQFFDTGATNTMTMTAPTTGFTGAWQLPNQAGTFAVAASPPLALNTTTGVLTLPTSATPQFANIGVGAAPDTAPLKLSTAFPGSPAANDFGLGGTVNSLNFGPRWSDGSTIYSGLAELSNADISLGGQTASIGATTIATPAASTSFLVAYLLYCHSTGSAGTVSLSILANDGVATVTQTSATVTLTSLNNATSGVFMARVSSTQSLQYSTTLTGGVGSPNYNLYISITPLTAH